MGKKPKLCATVTEFGRCQQPARPNGWCSAHNFWETVGVTPDRTYHRKIVEGIIQPTWDYLTTVEAEALLNGRHRGDGRRLDQYVGGDRLMIDTDGFHECY